MDHRLTDHHCHVLTKQLVETLQEWDVPLDQARACLADAMTDYTAHVEEEAERAWEDFTSSPPDHGFYRTAMRDAGRGHLLGDG